MLWLISPCARAASGMDPEALKAAFASTGRGRGARRGSRGRGGRGRGRGRGASASGRGGRGGRGGGGGPDKSTGDWNCPSCGNYNYKFRDECNKCNTSRSGAPTAEAEASASLSSTQLDEGQLANSGEVTGTTTSKAKVEVRKTITKGKGRGKGPRQRVKQLTQQIVQYAKRRRLGDAQRVFQQLKDEGLTPGLLTFSTFINAHVASGDMIGAEVVFQDMQSAGVAANSVIYNTLFKGYCVAGNTARTAELFEEMSRQDVIPDTNTVNAHLSGCLRAGDVGDAHRVYTKMTEEWAAEPDFFTYKRAVQMLCRGLRLDALGDIHQKLQGLREQAVADTAAKSDDEAAGSGSGSAAVGGLEAALVWLHLHRGLSAALLGQWSVAAAAMQQVEAAGAAAAVAPEVHLARTSTTEQAAQVSSEDRGQHDFHLKVFEGEMRRLHDFLESQRVLATATASPVLDLQAIPPPDLQDALCKTFIFGAHTNAQARKQQLQLGGEAGAAAPASAAAVVAAPIAAVGEGLAAGLVRSLERYAHYTAAQTVTQHKTRCLLTSPHSTRLEIYAS